MNGILEVGLVVSLILFLLAVDFIVWMTGTLFLLGLLGWHPPGWLASPVAHSANTAMGVVGGALAIATPILLDLALKRIALI
jgi:hypothetical protein